MAEVPLRKPAGIGTGLVEIDQQLGGAIPWGSLALIEGKHAAGKTVLSQHLTYSALAAQSGVAYYTSETGSPSLLSQMASLGLDVMDHFLLDRLRIFPLELTDLYPEPDELLEVLIEHIAALPQEFRLVVIDSLSAFLPRCSQASVLNFFIECRQTVSRGQTICVTLDPRSSVEPVATQMYPWCDVHLRLQMEAVLVEQVAKTLRVIKSGGANTGDGATKVHFNVQPGLGMNVLWPRRSLP